MLIATDLDGTLVPHGATEPGEYCAQVLRRVDEAGVPVVFVTGRPLRWMTGFWPHVGRQGLAIVSNGAVVYDVRAGAVIEHAGIAPDLGLDLLAAITDAAPGATFAIECLDGIRQDSSYADLLPHPARRGPLRELWDAPALKLLVRNPPGMADEELRECIFSVVGEQATATWSMSGLIEISAAGVTKASALQSLCARLGVPREDVVAFGDMPNDIPMLSWAGTAYGMQHAHESVRAVIDHVVPATAIDGVAYVLEAIMAR